MTAQVVPDGPAGWTEAVEVLRAGGVVALPTAPVRRIRGIGPQQSTTVEAAPP